MNKKNKPHSYAICVMFLLLPFLVLYWTSPFFSKLTIGNDYPVFSIFNQMELMFSLKLGSFPLYIPGYAGGTSFATLTLGQIFHPISRLAAMLPGYWDGKALELNTLLRFLSLGLTQIVLFYFLRALKLKKTMAFLLSFVTVYNLRMLDLFRYGASLETYTAHLLLYTFIAWYYIKPSRYIGVFCIASVYLVMCAGHPQMMYYAFVTGVPLTVFMPYYISSVVPELDTERSHVFRFYQHIFVFFVAGVLLSSAYVLPLYFDFILDNGGRVGQNFTWASNYLDTFVGTFDNFFRPLCSELHGAFGGSSLLIIPAITPLLLLFRVKVPRVILSVWGIFFIAFLHMQGPRTPIFHFIWKYFPFASSFRIPGRISIIIPFILLLLFVWIVLQENIKFRFFNRDFAASPLLLLAVLALIVFVAYNVILLLPSFRQTDTVSKMRALPDWFDPGKVGVIARWVKPVVGLTGVLSLIALVLYASEVRARHVAVILCLATCVQATVSMRYGTWVTLKADTASFAQMLSEKKERLSFFREVGSGLYTKSIKDYIDNVCIEYSDSSYYKQANKVRPSLLQDDLGKVYTNYSLASSRSEAYSILRDGDGKNNGLVLEGYSPVDDEYRVKYANGRGADSVILKFASFNMLKFDVFSSREGVFVFSFPFNKNWGAFVNSRESKIYCANGFEQAVYLPAGSSEVVFKYWSSSAFCGVLISSLTLLVVLLWFSVRIPGKGARLFVFLLSIVLTIFIFTSWYKSLYSGKNIGTEYKWESVYKIYKI